LQLSVWQYNLPIIKTSTRLSNKVIVDWLMPICWFRLHYELD